MITAIDINVLLDVFGADAKFGEASALALRRCIAEGAIVACEVVWVEAGAAFSSAAAFAEAMKTLAVGFSSANELTVLAAARAWRGYRTRGGKRERVVAEMTVRDDLCTAGERVHGGALMALADTAAAMGTAVSLPDGL